MSKIIELHKPCPSQTCGSSNAYCRWDDGHGFNCLKCNMKFDRSRIGQASKVCPECYPTYRKSINLFHMAKHRATKKSIPFDLNPDWIFERLKQGCEITKLQFKLNNSGQNYKNRHPLTPSIDKINPNLGYTKGNCRLVIWWYNMAKLTHSDMEVWHLCSLIVNSLDMKDVLNAQKKVEIPQEII